MQQSYESTRSSNLKNSASIAVLKGIADDGGLYVMRNLEQKKNTYTKLNKQKLFRNGRIDHKRNVG